MADDTDNLDPLIGDLAKYGIGAAGTLGANASTQAAYEAILKNLRDRFAGYENLPAADYQKLTPHQLGPSALEGIAPDAQARIDEQGAISQLDDISKSGGLTLADKAALNELERNLGRNDSARRASIENQYAARGALNSGTKLAMELTNAQNETQNANTRGESIAAQAQQRAMDAVLKKGSMARSMSNDDYARKEKAARAADEISRYNASMSMDADKYNNNIAGQSYDDQLRRLGGENQVTGQLNTALLGSGQQQANTVAGAAYGGTGIVDALGTAGSKLAKGLKGTGGGSSTGSGSGGNPDETGDRGGATDLGAGGDKGDPNAEPGTNYGGSDPSEWESPYPY